MKKVLIAAAFLAALAVPAPAQGLEIERPARKTAAPPARIESRFDAVFYKAYYLENEEKKVDQAVELYKEYLDKVGPRSFLGRKAFARLTALLEKKGDKKELRKVRARFGRPLPGRRHPGMQGRRMGMGVMVQPKPLSREEWIKRRTEMIARFEKRIEQMKQSGRGEQFTGRMEQMLERMKKELEAVKKGAPVPKPRMMMGRPGQAQGRRPGRRRGIFGTQFAKMPPDQRDKAFTSLIERLVSFQERMKERGREDAAKRMKTLIDKLEGLAAKGKWEEVDKTLREGFRRRR